jgi:hypothetical protein
LTPPRHRRSLAPIRGIRRKHALTKATQEDLDVVAWYAMAKFGIDLRSATR